MSWVTLGHLFSSADFYSTSAQRARDPNLKSKSCATNGPVAREIPGSEQARGWQYAGPYQLSHTLAGFPISLSQSEWECFQDSYHHSQQKATHNMTPKLGPQKANLNPRLVSGPGKRFPARMTGEAFRKSQQAGTI